MSLHEAVAVLMRDVAEAVVLPRFGKLDPRQVAEKSPGEIVTSVDCEAERRLHHGLAGLGLGARIVGEEAVAADPALLDRVGEGLVWLVDPLDGTANFAAGRAPFGMMVALVDEGLPIAGWLLDPLSGRLCHAARGLGALCDGRPVRARRSAGVTPIAALATQFMPRLQRAHIEADAARAFDLVPIPRCAAEHYPRLVLGQNDVALFQRILPWDHAAGVLFLNEAGGCARHWDGRPYRVGGEGIGLLAAAAPGLWELASAALFDAEAGQHLERLRAA